MIWYDAACLVHNFLEIRPFKHNLKHCLLLNLKHSILWYSLSSYFGSHTISSMPFHIVSVVANMAIIQVTSSFLANQEVVTWRTKLAEMMLIKEQIENAVEALPDGLVVVDADLTIRLDNSITKRLVPAESNFEFGYTKRSYGPGESTLDLDIRHFLRSEYQEVTFGVTKINDCMCEWKGNAVVWEG
jgi:hypothetical protein